MTPLKNLPSRNSPHHNLVMHSPAHAQHQNNPYYHDAGKIVDSLKAFYQWQCSSELSLVAADDQTFSGWMGSFLDLRGSFDFQGKPTLIEIGYHYTDTKKMADISYAGLKSSKGRRHFFGRGIYAANNPHAFRCYGDTGLIVLVMKGVQRWCLNNEEDRDATGVDTFSGNKVFDKMDKSSFTRSSYFDEIVLRNDAQVVPLFKYKRGLTNNEDQMWRVHLALQSWIDSMFRPGFPPTKLLRHIPCFDDVKYEHKLIAHHGLGSTAFLTRTSNTYFIFGIQQKKSPSNASLRKSNSVLLYSEYCMPMRFKTEKMFYYFGCMMPKPDDDCPICYERLKTDVVALTNCKHCFHRNCLKDALQHKMQCPICRDKVGEVSGSSPYGSMKVILDMSLHCSGFPNIPTYIVTYEIPDGIQTDEHDNPGTPFSGTKRRAFFPKTKDGKDLIKRLRYAFRRGLTFRVGISLTTGKSNTVVWASIVHKTTTGKHAYGWPDQRYFENVNSELDRLEVPNADKL